VCRGVRKYQQPAGRNTSGSECASSPAECKSPAREQGSEPPRHKRKKRPRSLPLPVLTRNRVARCELHFPFAYFRVIRGQKSGRYRSGSASPSGTGVVLLLAVGVAPDDIEFVPFRDCWPLGPIVRSTGRRCLPEPVSRGVGTRRGPRAWR
jgi:hypothetical protein